MKNKNTVILVAIIVFIVAMLVYVKQKNNSSSPYNTSTQQMEESQEAISNNSVVVNVVAKNGTFEPNVFGIHPEQTLVLMVNATDSDYSFSIEDFPRLTTQFPKGKMTSHKVDYLGVGQYEFSCGPKCSGIITVESSNDSD